MQLRWHSRRAEMMRNHPNMDRQQRLSLKPPRSGTPSRMRRVIALSPMRDFRPLAEQGNARAQFYLGAMYHYGGHGVTQDDVEAAKWFRKAAEQGDVTSQFIIGSMYSVGEGVPRNYAEAKKWWLLAVKKGHADAQLGLGDIYK